MEWLDKLRDECARTSQTQVAERLRCYSTAVVSSVLGGTYKGDWQAVQMAVEGLLMGATVTCPVMGEVAANRCLEEQRKPFAATNPRRVALYRACRGGCVNSRIN